MRRMATGWPNSSPPMWIGSYIDSIGPAGTEPVAGAGPVMMGFSFAGWQGGPQARCDAGA